VYIGSEQLYALDTVDGSMLWTFNPGRESGIQSSPVLVDDIVYVGSWRNPSSGAVHADDSTDGTELWRFPTGGYVEAAPKAVDGTVYVGSKAGDLIAVTGPPESEKTTTSPESPTRAQRAEQEWRFETSGQIRGSPAVVGGTAYFGSTDYTLYAVDAADGTEQWTFDIGGTVNASPAVVDGVVYVGSGYDGPVYALNAADGTEQWRYESAKPGYTSPVVTDDAVVIPGEENTVVSLARTDGRERWTQQLGGEDGVVESMAATGDVIYAPCDAAGLQALDADDGSIQWSALGGVESPPAVAGGTVYVGTRDDKLYALREQ
jgi:outer membrane protein assembly factor BamB